MPEYILTYWPLPFRGQFIRATLAHVGASYEETEFDAIVAGKSLPPADQAIPHMGPPLLTDQTAGITLSQTQAILAYLGAKYGLMPDDPLRLALTHKIIADTNDVLCDMTRNNGAQMWTPETWAEFQPRLERWMDMFEVLSARYQMTPETGYILGTDTPGLADLVTATLWGTMSETFPPLRPTLDGAAPAIAGLSDRIAALPAQQKLRRDSAAKFGDIWCGGQIEASLRAVLA